MRTPPCARDDCCAWAHPLASAYSGACSVPCRWARPVAAECFRPRSHLPSGAYDRSRNHINVLSADVVVALRGGIGTKHEVKLARDYGKPVVDLHDLESFARVKQEVVKAFL